MQVHTKCIQRTKDRFETTIYHLEKTTQEPCNKVFLRVLCLVKGFLQLELNQRVSLSCQSRLILNFRIHSKGYWKALNLQRLLNFHGGIAMLLRFQHQII